MTDSNTPNNTPQTDDTWQQDVVNKLAFAALNEQRRSRRWRIFFLTLTFAYLFMIFFAIYLPDDSRKGGITGGKHTAIVELKGLISDESEASADNIITGLRAAFEDKKTAGVILRINSPGGSPVQSGYIYDEIVRLRKKYPDTKLYAVVTDMCASGGYYIASAADEIYADKASIVGSIGVLMNSFGFVEAMKKIGVERRLYTAGENKGMLDPFSKENPDDVKHINKMLGTIHQQFIDVVKKGRGDRLKEDPKLFSGMFWTGEQSVELGLIDGLASSSHVAREIIKEEKLVDFTPRPDYLDRFASKIGASMSQVLSNQLGLNGTSLR